MTIEERVIEIHTNAVDKATGEKMIVAGKEVTVIDTVTLDGLEKGTTYQLKGWQMVKSENAQLLIGGEPVESDYTFTAKDSSMEVQIAFTFNASDRINDSYFVVYFNRLFTCCLIGSDCVHSDDTFRNRHCLPFVLMSLCSATFVGSSGLDKSYNSSNVTRSFPASSLALNVKAIWTSMLESFAVKV